MRKLATILIGLLWMSVGINGANNESGYRYDIDGNGNVVFTVMAENLPLTKNDIFLAAHEYMENAYKDTRYTITAAESSNGFVAGLGSFQQFYETNHMFKSVIFNADFTLRVDAKDGRARVQIHLRNYKQLTLSDVGKNQTEEVLICGTPPLAQGGSGGKTYKKAFDNLQDKVDRIFKAILLHLQNARPKPTADDNW